MNNDQQGGLLLEVIASLGIVLAISAVVIKSKLNAKFVAKQTFEKSSSEFGLEGFTRKLGDFSLKYSDAVCRDAQIKDTRLEWNDTQAQLSSNIETQIKSGDAKTIATRCTRQQIDKRNGQIYFCLKFDQNSDYPAGSFLGAKDNFAEVAIRLVDKLQRPVNCDFLKSSQVGAVSLQIYYRFYWIPESNSPQLHKKSGFYYAI